MTTSAEQHNDDPASLERSEAWKKALGLFADWRSADDAARGHLRRAANYSTGAGKMAISCLRDLTALIVEHGFEGTRVDPELPEAERLKASYACPPAGDAA